MKEFEVEIRVRNNLLKQRRTEIGLSQRELAFAAGVSQWTITVFESMRESPISRRGGWKSTAKRIAQFFCVDEEDIWPDVVRNVSKHRATVQVDAAGVQSLIESDGPQHKRIELRERAQAVNQALGVLTDRERHVLEARCGFDGSEGLSLDKIAKDMFLSKERVRRIEAKALRKLRHPSVCSGLKEHYVS